jgi:amidophosphoribosyltransferase
MCGIFGARAKDSISIIELAKYGMLQIKHRGQSGAGVTMGSLHGNSYFSLRRLGTVESIVGEIGVNISVMNGYTVCQTRYPTTGDFDREENLQPFSFQIGDEIFSLVFNGNLVNFKALRAKLKKQGYQFITDTDTEVLALIFQIGFLTASSDKIEEQVFAGIKQVYSDCRGGYAVIIQRKNGGIIAFRDQHGIRPLVMAQSENFLAFASETQAFPLVEDLVVSDVNPAEGIFYQEDAGLHRRQFEPKQTAYDSFELVYMASSDAVYNGQPIIKVRRAFGHALGEQWLDESFRWKPTLLIPIPNTSLVAGAAMYEVLGRKIPGLQYGEGAVRINPASARSVRSFIQATSAEQDQILREKHIVNPHLVAGQDVLLLDDSVVRGKTLAHIIAKVKKAGARSVSVGVFCPEVIGSDYYGIATPRKDELISASKSAEGLREYYGVEEILFLSQPRFHNVLSEFYPNVGFHTGYFDETYVEGTPSDYPAA